MNCERRPLGAGWAKMGRHADLCPVPGGRVRLGDVYAPRTRICATTRAVEIRLVFRNRLGIIAAGIVMAQKRRDRSYPAIEQVSRASLRLAFSIHRLPVIIFRVVPGWREAPAPAWCHPTGINAKPPHRSRITIHSRTAPPACSSRCDPVIFWGHSRPRRQSRAAIPSPPPLMAS